MATPAASTVEQGDYHHQVDKHNVILLWNAATLQLNNGTHRHLAWNLFIGGWIRHFPPLIIFFLFLFLTFFWFFFWIDLRRTSYFIFPFPFVSPSQPFPSHGRPCCAASALAWPGQRVQLLLRALLPFLPHAKRRGTLSATVLSLYPNSVGRRRAINRPGGPSRGPDSNRRASPSIQYMYNTICIAGFYPWQPKQDCCQHNHLAEATQPKPW